MDVIGPGASNILNGAFQGSKLIQERCLGGKVLHLRGLHRALRGRKEFLNVLDDVSPKLSILSNLVRGSVVDTVNQINMLSLGCEM